MKGVARRLRELAGRGSYSADLDRVRCQLGSIESRLISAFGPADFAKAEFRVFSQFGEDGLVQFLVQRVPIEHEVFVELGVGDFQECNTRFLLEHDNWVGLVIDAREEMCEFIRTSGLAWRHDIRATTAFVRTDNVDELIEAAGISGDIGLLSIDLDGNDYWILETVAAVQARIIVVEYNSIFGPERAVTVPYDPDFVRHDKHWSGLYWGASLSALAHSAARKGYALVGGNRAGNNAFFVRRDVLGVIPEVSVDEAYRMSRFRESRGQDGELTYLSGHDQRLVEIGELPLVDVRSGQTANVRDLFGLDARKTTTPGC